VNPGTALFAPFTCRDIVLRNRIMLSPMCQYVAEDGHATAWHRAHHARFALGGIGGAVVEATAVTPEGRITPGCLGIWSDAHVPALAEIVATYRTHGVRVGIQLAHAGRKASAAVPWEGAQPLPGDDPRAWQAIAPSAIPFLDGWPAPAALDDEAIAAVIDAFVAAAHRAVAAGFDFVEVHGAHGYLIHSFVSPLSNRREDRWGGDEAGRFRLPVTIVARLRAALPPGMPIFYRLSLFDGAEGGLVVDDMVRLAAALGRAGADVIDCSSGGVRGSSGVADAPPSPGYLVPAAGRIRREAGVATMAVGLIVTPEIAAAAIDHGDADLVAIGRELLADSNFAYRAALELGVPDAHRLLPRNYAFFLERRRLRER
jgi:2,4-dienoyl-CoA reductase-like NADH-dependent reductase (Old Yellow Enzyme family)